MSNELEPQAGESAESFKLRIEKKQAELAAPARASAPAASANGTSQPRTDSLPEAKAVEPSPVNTETPQGLNAPANGSQTQAAPSTSKQDAGDPNEWYRKKGFKSESDLIQSYRAMEDEFHRRNQTKWKQAPEHNAQSAPQAPPAYQPAPMAPQMNPPPVPSYGPQPVDPRAVAQQLAPRYNLAPEDLMRVLPLIADVAEARISQRDQEWSQKFATVEKENSRNSEFRELMQDPVFKNPQVQMEMHRVFEEHPDSFDRESAPYKWAYDQALSRMARRNLQDTLGAGSFPNGPFMPPTTPPPVGLGAGMAGSHEAGPLTSQAFADLPLEEKQKLLTRMGARPRPY